MEILQENTGLPVAVVAVPEDLDHNHKVVVMVVVDQEQLEE